MNRIILIIVVGIFFLPSFATTRVHGYTKKDGTYDTPHNRTSPNGNLFDEKYVGSVRVNDANSRFYEAAPGRNWIMGVKASLSF